MKYKAGDKVRIRKDLKADVQYGSKRFTNLMCKYRGKETTITKVLSNFYTLKVDDEMWSWSEEMLEPVTECDFNIGDKVIFNPAEKDKLTGVFTVSEIDMDLNMPYIKLKEVKECMWFNPNRLFKVPLFKVGQIVQFKNIKEDKWYPGTDDMANLEGKLGMVAEIKINFYTVDKPNQDGCQYSVRDLTAGRWWSVTSAAIEPVSEVEHITSITSIGKTYDPDCAGLRVIADDNALAVAQAVDNVKGPQFKIGDRVLIREDLVPGKKYEEWDYSPEDGMGGWEFAAAMAKYMGKVATITGYVANDPNYCCLDIDKGTYSWIVNALLHYTPGSDYDLDRTIITYKQTKQNYENRLQEKGPVIAGRERQSGCEVRYPGEQIRVGISNLGYRKVTCKR